MGDPAGRAPGANGCSGAGKPAPSRAKGGARIGKKVQGPVRNIMVTGGAGFIGGALCRHLVAQGGYRVINVDKLTYSGNPESLGELRGNRSYSFHRADVSDHRKMEEILRSERVDNIVHLAAETHVDRSIDEPAVFLQTNVVGTFGLLNAALAYWRDLDRDKRASFRFLHVSTDEVYGDLPLDKGIFKEEAPYRPTSPYAASKAASDHFVRAWHRTYDLPVVLSTSSNNYGPYQHPEKLIPLVIANAIRGKPLPVYGEGLNVRDWLFVEDHARALERILTAGRVGETYNVGGGSERSNIEVVEAICDRLDTKRPLGGGHSYRSMIRFVADRPGHDRRYALDCGKIEGELSWTPTGTFERGLSRTIDWYLDNEWWWQPLLAAPGERERADLHGVAEIADRDAGPRAGP